MVVRGQMGDTDYNMKKIFILTIFAFTLVFAWPHASFAQGDDLSNKTVTCAQLKDADFEKVGEYFMGKMVGSSHEAMNTMMVGMMGKVGEEQMHIAIGKRMSNCEPNTSMPQNMMNMMGGGNYMMNNGWGLFGIATGILITVFLILGIIYFWKEINRRK